MDKNYGIVSSVLVASILATTSLHAATPCAEYSFIYNKTSKEENSSTRASLVTPPPPQNRWLERFYVGAMTTEADYGHGYSQLNTLGFTLWHNYTGATNNTIAKRWYPKMDWNHSVPNDSLMEAVSNYAGEVNRNITEIYNSPTDGSKRKLILMRPKIEWLCFGQSSIYEAEPISTSDPLWFYSFQTHIGDPVADYQFNNGDTVLHCGMPQMGANANYVLKRLKANTEQCHRIISNYQSNQWMGDSECDWLIKPRIRIPVDFAMNPQNYNTPICRIYILNQDGNIFKNRIPRFRAINEIHCIYW